MCTLRCASAVLTRLHQSPCLIRDAPADLCAFNCFLAQNVCIHPPCRLRGSSGPRSRTAARSTRSGAAPSAVCARTKSALTNVTQKTHTFVSIVPQVCLLSLTNAHVVYIRAQITGIKRSAFKNRGALYSQWGCSIRCVREDQSALTNVVHYLNDGTCTFKFSHRKQVRLRGVFWALGFSSDDCAVGKSVFGGKFFRPKSLGG